MFAGFNLKIPEYYFGRANEHYYKAGEKCLAEQKQRIREKLTDYILNEKTVDNYILDKRDLLIKTSTKHALDGTAIQNDWFGQVKADIFLSHAHRDEKLVVSLAGWYKEECNVQAFVDSHIWGYANDLLKKIDNKYSRLQYNDEDTAAYSYKKRNESTSHVHIMLNTALEQMIDKCECLFFCKYAEFVIY